MRSRMPNEEQRLALCADVKPMSKSKFRDTQAWTRNLPDDLVAIADWFHTLPEGRERFGWVLRDALDELLDGGRTGRWAYDQLGKTEKTHLGSIIEIKLSREFQIPEGDTIDWKIGSDELDCKFSRDFGAWEIPIEMYLPAPDAEPGSKAGIANHAALLVWMNDDNEQWAAGLVRVDHTLLRVSRNRDRKRKIETSRLDRVHWLWGGRHDDLPRNLFLTMTADQRRQVFEPRSGQQRVNQLLHILEGSLVPRAVIATAAIQDDPMKRARDARLPQHLGQHGYLIVGHQDADPYIARQLQLPQPSKGEVVPCRITPRPTGDPRPAITINGTPWCRANADDAEVAAPVLPKKTPPEGWATYLDVGHWHSARQP